EVSGAPRVRSAAVPLRRPFVFRHPERQAAVPRRPSLERVRIAHACREAPVLTTTDPVSRILIQRIEGLPRRTPVPPRLRPVRAADRTVTRRHRDCSTTEASPANGGAACGDGKTSSLMSVAVRDANTSAGEMGFAAAVAEFGMLLRDSEFKGS